MAHTIDDGDEIISQINITPLVDIVLVILLVFIVTTSMVLRSTIPMNLPKAATGSEEVAGLINIAVSEDGAVYLNGRPGMLEDIPELVAQRRLALAGKNDEKISAMVSADTTTQYGRFVRVVDTLRKAGVYQIALDVQPELNKP